MGVCKSTTSWQYVFIGLALISCVAAAQYQKCEMDVLEMFMERNLVHIEMIDFSGKAVNDMGNYDGCLSLDHTIARYCLLATNVQVPMANERLPVYMGLCVPQSCDAASLATLIKLGLTDPRWNISTNFPISDEVNSFSVNCSGGKESKFHVGAILTIILIAVLVLMTAAGTYLETIVVIPSEEEKSLLRSEEEAAAAAAEKEAHNAGSRSLSSPAKNFALPLSNAPKQRKSGKLQNILKCFGLMNNMKLLLADNRATEPRLASLNGLRTVMLAWVILGHTFAYMAAPVGYDNLMTVRDTINRVSFQAVPAAELAVDVFFYLSGFLVAYLVLKEMNAKRGRVNWMLFYFHRYWRLTPVYAFTILVYTNLVPYMVQGPFQYQFRTLKTDLCVRYWWTNMLYINNFYPVHSEDACLGWSWYLANDTQFYIITPAILILYYRNKRAGWVLVSLLTSVCLMINAILSYHYRVGPLDPNNTVYSSFIYGKPYARIAPYLVGIFSAFLAHEEVDVTRHKLVRWIGYLISLIVTTTTVYLTVGFWRHGWNLLQDVLYTTFSRTGFTMAFAWVMYTIFKGHCSLIGKPLSLYMWLPFTRLNYTAYLVHPIIIFVINFSSTTVFHYSAVYGTIRYASHLFLAYLLALIFYLLVEKPTANLERVFLPHRGHSKNKH